MRVSLLALLAVVLAPGGLQSDAGAEVPVRPRVMVLAGQDAPPFQTALDGLRRRLGPAVDLTVVTLHASPDRFEAQVRASIEAAPAVLVALGSAATRAAIAHGSAVPIVAGMILEPEEVAGWRHATGVYLQFPVAVELEWMTRLLPSARRIGVMYHGPGAIARVAEARRVAPRLGLTLHAFQVAGPEQIPDALAALAGQSDLLWGQLDPVVFNPETAKPILLFSFRSLIPLAGPAPTWTRAGGLLALERDYQDIGVQCAELVERILAGTPPSALPPVAPRTVRYVLNARTAEQVRVSFPAAVARGAVEVFR